jgi:hypothetical protein
MVKHFAMVVLLLVSYSQSNCQITKKNWLVGGAFSYSNWQSEGTDAIIGKFSNFNAIANIGYFPIDKLAFGLAVNSRFAKSKYSQVDGTTTTDRQSVHGLGPFLRYYFLPTEKRINLLTQAGFIYSFYSNSSSGSNSNTFDWNLAAGPVIYFNSSVALELLASYNHSKSIGSDNREKKILLQIGFQIHLEKEK